MQFIFGLASTTKAMSSSSSRHLTAITTKAKTLSLTINITIMPITILTRFAKLRRYSKYLCVWDKMICENFATVVPTSSSGNKPVLLDRIKSWLVDFIVKNMLIVKNMFCVVNSTTCLSTHPTGAVQGFADSASVCTETPARLLPSILNKQPKLLHRR